MLTVSQVGFSYGTQWMVFKLLNKGFQLVIIIKLTLLCTEYIPENVSSVLHN